MRPKCLLGNRIKVISVCDNKYDNQTGCIKHALEALKERKILIGNKRNITKLANIVYPETHSVVSFMVIAFHRLNVSSIRCIQQFPSGHSKELPTPAPSQE